jgi:putative membrane protein
MLHGSDGMGWWMVFDGLLWVLLLGSLFFLAVRVLERGRHSDVDTPKDALEIAKRRYARGEIGADELAEIRRNLAPHREAAA